MSETLPIISTPSERLLISVTKREFFPMEGESREGEKEDSSSVKVLKTICIFYFYISFLAGWTLLSTMYPLLLDFVKNERLSLGFTIRAFGGMCGAFFTPPLISFFERYLSINVFILITIASLSTTQVLVPSVPNLYFMFFLFFYEAFVFGTLFCGLTLYLEAIWLQPNKIVLHSMHACAGLAGVSFKTMISLILKSNIDSGWKLRFPYVVQSLFLISSSIPFFFFKIKSPRKDKFEKYEDGIQSSGVFFQRKIFRSLKIIFSVKFLIFLGLAIGVHLGIAPLLINSGATNYFLVTEMNNDPSDSVLKLTAFNFCFMVSRLLVIPLSLYFSSAQILLILYAFGLWSAYLMWVFGPHSTAVIWIGVMTQGFFSAPTLSPYFTVTVQEFGWKLHPYMVSAFSYLAILSWTYPTLTIYLMDNVSPQMFNIILVALYTINFFWNSFVILSGKYFCGCSSSKNRSKKKDNVNCNNDQ